MLDSASTEHESNIIKPGSTMFDIFKNIKR